MQSFATENDNFNNVHVHIDLSVKLYTNELFIMFRLMRFQTTEFALY